MEPYILLGIFIVLVAILYPFYASVDAAGRKTDALQQNGFRVIDGRRKLYLQNSMRVLATGLEFCPIFERRGISTKTFETYYEEAISIIITKKFGFGRCYVAKWRKSKGDYLSMHIDLNIALPDFIIGSDYPFEDSWIPFLVSGNPVSDKIPVFIKPGTDASDYAFLPAFVESITSNMVETPVICESFVISLILHTYPSFGKTQFRSIDSLLTLMETATQHGHIS